MDDKIKIFLKKYKNKFFKTPDYAQEIAYWKWWLPENWEKVSNREAWKKIFPKPLIMYINELKKDNNCDLRILEIGSGPVSLLAWGVDNNLFQLVAIDALADSYEKIMEKYNYFYPIKPIKGYGEKLFKVVNKNSFDLVYSSNALDHVESPQKCLKNIYNALKKDGVICLEGYINEGAIEHFVGLHKYNLHPVNNQLFCSNANNKTVNLTKKLKLKCVYQKIVKAKERGCDTPFVRNTDDDWYTVIFQKI